MGDINTFHISRINARTLCRVFAGALVTPSPTTALPCLGNISVHVASTRIHQLQRHSPHAEQSHIQGQTITGQKSMKSCNTRFTTAENTTIIGGKGVRTLKAEYNLKKTTICKNLHMEVERASTKPKIFNSEIKAPPHVFYIYADIYSAFIAGKDIALLFTLERWGGKWAGWTWSAVHTDH